MYYFTEDCLTGVKEIDDEHRELFRILNELHDLLANELLSDKYDRTRKLLERLKDYTQCHFAHEEAYMESINHPELELQRRQHSAFTAKISEMDVTLPGSDQQGFLNDLLQYLVTWLYRHIIGSDMMIGKLIPAGEWEDKTDLRFTKEYLTGIELIDQEHQELFRIIGEANNLIKNEFIPDKYDEIVHLLDELCHYTAIHFKDEENYMESIGYAGLPAQKAAHEAFVQRLGEMDLDRIDANQQETLEELIQFLTEWLINHILHSDKKIGGTPSPM